MSFPDEKFIYLIDDDESVRVSLKSAFETVGYCVIPFISAEEFLSQQDFFWPAILVMDVRMPKISGVQLQGELIKKGMQLPIIFISGQSTVEEAVLGIKRGAIDFLTKPLNMQVLMQSTLHAFEKVLKDHKENHRRLSREQQLEKLAPREREACFLIAKGYTNLEVSQKLGIKADTAKQYKKQIFQKLGVDGVPALIEFMN